MESDLNNIEFQLMMQKSIEEIDNKIKLKEQEYIKAKQKMCDSSEKFESLAPEEEKSIIDMHESSMGTPPLTLKSQFMNQLDSKDSLDKSKSQENLINNSSEYIIKNLNTGESYDIRNLDIIDSLTSKSKQLIDINKEKAWQDYWKNIKKNYEKLWDAAELGNLNKLQDLIASNNKPYPLDLNAKTLDDWTALHLAANEGHIQIVELLLKNDINKEAITKMGRKAIHIATIRGNYEVVKLLIEAKCDLDYQDDDQCTPLHYAAEHGYEKIIRELLENKANTSLKNYQGMRPIDLSQDHKIREIFEKLGVLPDEESGYGRTPYGTTIRNTARADYVSRLLFWGNMHKIQNTMNSNGNTNKPANELTVNCNGNKEKNGLDLNNGKDIKSKPEVILQCSATLPKKKVKESSLSPLPKKEEKKHNTNTMKISKIMISSEKIGPDSFVFYKLLGKGSFGEVYLVEKKSNHQIYAMKVLQKDKIINQNLVRYAKAERDVLSIVNHPFMVRLNYAFQNESKLFLVMDYCQGGDLGKLLSKKKKLTEDVCRIYLSEIILALESLHKSLIIFRDLKPDNVVLDEDGHAMLTDFGLSKQGMANNLTNSFCGSVAYLAPEILFKAGHSRTVDWYLLGVMMYELLVGIPPYYSNNREELFENIKKGPLMIPKSLSEECKSLIKKLLCRNPTQRLGAKEDGEEIKRHPWFKDINWEDVYNRKLIPPPIIKKNFSLDSPLKVKFDDGEKKKEVIKRGGKNHLDNWTFVGADEKDILNANK